MSHFTSVKTQIRNISLLDETMKALGLQKVERKTVNGYRGQRTSADHVWRVDSKYDVGAIKNADGTYDLVADWWGTGYDLQRQILQGYSLQNIVQTARLRGDRFTKEEQPDGRITVRIPVPVPR